MGAVFAILGVLIGSFATLYLFKSICLHLDKSTLQKISIAYLVCAVFSILTWVAAALDVCDAIDDPFYDCQRTVHVAEGGVAEIFAMLFFLAAAAATFQFSRVTETTRTEIRSTVSEPEVLPLQGKDPPLASKLTSVAASTGGHA
jgi:hypothetical protein